MMRSGSAGEMTKLNALSAAKPVGSDAHRSPHVARGHREGIEGDRRRAVAVDVERLRLDRRGRRSPASACRRSRRASMRLTTAAVTATRSWLENSRPRQRHGGHRDVRLIGGPVDRHRRQHRPRRQPRAFLAAPPVALEVADQHHLAPRQPRLGQHAPRHLQRRRVAGCAGARLGGGDRGRQRRACRTECRSTISAPGREQHQRSAVVGTEVVHRGVRGRTRALPAVAVADAVALVEEDDDLARALRAGQLVAAARRTAARTPR